MLKIVFISNIPAPYQIEWAKALNDHFVVQFWFMSDIKKSISKRPSYWNVDLPPFCRILPAKFQKRELCYGPTLVKELNTFNPDIVLLGGAWYMIAWLQAYFWALKHNKKIVVGPLEFHHSMYNSIKKYRNLLIYKILYRKINLFLANAYIHYDYLKWGLKLKNVALFMNFDNYEPYITHPIRTVDDSITFMYGGSISRRMRIPELLDVFENLAEKYTCTKLIISGYGPEKQICVEKVKNSKTLNDRVRFIDASCWSDIQNAYLQSDVFINYASYSPGAGVILSSIASGMGIISDINVNATRHFVIDNYNGFIIDGANALYNAMEQYTVDKSLVIIHGKRNKVIAKINFSFDKHIVDFKNAISQLNI